MPDKMTNVEWILLLIGVIALGYSFYQVWFRPGDFSRLQEELYTESSHTARAFARSKFTLWGYRIVISVLFLAFLLALLAALAFRLLDAFE